MATTIRAEFALYTVTYHEVADAEVTEIVDAVKAEAYVCVEIARDIKSLEGRP
jgi:hypothetical protein